MQLLRLLQREGAFDCLRTKKGEECVRQSHHCIALNWWGVYKSKETVSSLPAD